MAGDGVKAGMTAALSATGAGDPPRDDAEQLPLLPDMSLDTSSIDESGEDAGSRGPGRPKGSPNKRTADMVAYITSRYGSPLERLAQIYSADPAVLAKAHGIKTKEALDHMRHAAVAALPYIEQKRPVMIDVEGKGRMTLVIGNIGDADPGELTEDGLSVIIDLEAQEMDDE